MLNAHGQLARMRSLTTTIQRLNQSLELERVTQLLASEAVRLLDASSARVLMLRERMLVTTAVSGLPTERVGFQQTLDESFAGQAVEALRLVHVDDLLATPAPLDPERAHLSAGGAPVPATAAPLVIGGRPIGALLVVGRAGTRFSAIDEELLTSLTTHGAIALENARLYRAAAQAARHAGIFAATAQTLAHHVSPDALYAGLARLVHEALHADGFSIHAAAGDELTRLHSDGFAALPNAPQLARWEAVAHEVVRGSSPRFIADVDTLGPRTAPSSPDAPHDRGSETTDGGAMALLPLIVESQTRGVLTLRFRHPRTFDDRERTLLIECGAAVAVAMRNAFLVDDLERRATRLSAVAKVQLALSRTELHEVYGEVYRAVASSIADASCFALLLADPTASHFVPQLLVVDGIVTWARALAPVPLEPDCAASIALRTGQAVATNHPVRSWAAFVPGTSAGAGVARSELAAPMVHGDRARGVLIIQSRHAGAFTSEDLELLSIIARQAGAAIDNARLIESLRDEREIAEAAARIAEAALSTSTAADAAAAILEVVSGVVPLASTAIGLRSDRDVITYVAATGHARPLVGTHVPIDESAARTVLRREPATSESVPDEPRDAVFPDGLLTRGGVALALAARNRQLGVLTAAPPSGSTLPPSSIDALRRLAPSVAVAMDVHVLGEAERRQRGRERMLATALATMDQPVFVLSLDRRVLYANDAAVREYGYSLDELSAMAIDVLVASAVPLRASDDLSRTPANVVVAEHVHRRKDGSQFPATVALGFIRQDDGLAIGQVLTVRNLTDERRIAEQLRQSEKLAALGELVAGVAHELNNPLAGISAFAQLLLEENHLTDEQRESARLIKREADRAVGVIRDLLLFSRKTGPSTGPVDLNGLINLTLRLRAYSLRASGVDVQTHLDPDLPELLGDDQRLQQVILNLVVNAEYAMRGVPTRRLVIRTARHGDSALLEVTDSGSGMSKDTMSRVFEPFFTTKPAGEGTGLGLSVSYGIIEAHAGTITVESAPGQGATFRVALPLPLPPAAARRGRSA